MPMDDANLIRVLIKHREIKRILKAIYQETKKSKIGVTVSHLAKLTRIERHRLVGMIDTLCALGVLVHTKIGMAKVVRLSDSVVKALLRTSIF